MSLLIQILTDNPFGKTAVLPKHIYYQGTISRVLDKIIGHLDIDKILEEAKTTVVSFRQEKLFSDPETLEFDFSAVKVAYLKHDPYASVRICELLCLEENKYPYVPFTYVPFMVIQNLLVVFKNKGIGISHSGGLRMDYNHTRADQKTLLKGLDETSSFLLDIIEETQLLLSHVKTQAFRTTYNKAFR